MVNISDLINNNPQFSDNNELKQYYDRDTKLYNIINGTIDKDKKYILIGDSKYFKTQIKKEF